MKSLSATAEDVKGWAILGLGAYLVYKFSGTFTALGDTATAAVESVTAPIKERATATAAKARVSSVAPNATAAQIATYQADAATLVAAYGVGAGFSSNYFMEDIKTAFTLLKSYSRLMLYNNAPYDAKTYKAQSAETKSSAQRKVNYKVLVPFYKDLSGGRDLVADTRKFLNKDIFIPYLKWIL